MRWNGWHAERTPGPWCGRVQMCHLVSRGSRSSEHQWGILISFPTSKEPLQTSSFAGLIRVVSPDQVRSFEENHDSRLWACLCQILQILPKSCDHSSRVTATLPLVLADVGCHSSCRVARPSVAEWHRHTPLGRCSGGKGAGRCAVVPSWPSTPHLCLLSVEMGRHVLALLQEQARHWQQPGGRKTGRTPSSPAKGAEQAWFSWLRRSEADGLPRLLNSLSPSRTAKRRQRLSKNPFLQKYENWRMKVIFTSGNHRSTIGAFGFY